MERIGIPGEEGQHAYALTLQLPLEGPICHGGIKLVLRTQGGQWLACSYQGSRHDIFISIEKVHTECFKTSNENLYLHLTDPHPADLRSYLFLLTRD
jgi:hypothetical protein